MRWPWNFAYEKEETKRLVAENEEAIEQIRRERELEKALTPEIRSRAKVLVKRGKTNRYTESLMLAWQSNQPHGGGEG